MHRVPTARGYEMSIYGNIPGWIWMFLILSIAIAISINWQQDGNNLAIYYVMFMSICFILLLPIIKGYFMYGRGDALTHVGTIREILGTGTIEQSNIYPVIHILGSSISLITGNPPTYPRYIIPFITSLILFSAVFLVSRQVVRKSSYSSGYPVYTLSFIPILGYGHVYFGPNLNMLFILIFVIYGLYRLWL
jgi:hypothetical protein